MFGKLFRDLFVVTLAALFSLDAIAGSLSLLDNTTFIRDKGTSKVETIQFDGQPGSQFQLTLFNGGVDNQYCRITSAVISLNGQTIFSPGDFKKKTYQLTRAVEIETTNSLRVELHSKHGCAVEINVQGVPPLPTLSITSTPPEDAVSGQAYSYQITTAPEVDWGQLAAKLNTAPAPMTVIGGLIQWTPTDQDEDKQQVSVEVSHPDFDTATQDFSIDVLNSNDAPVVEDLAVELPEDTSSVFYLSVSVSDDDSDDDSDEDALVFTITTPPQNGQLTLLGNQATYVPVQDFYGSDQFDYQVNDGESNSNIATVSITVTPLNDAPQITSAPITVAAENTLYAYQIESLDVDADVLTFQIDVFPAGMTIDSQSGLISWTPTSDQLGLQNVSVSATDPQGLTDTQSFSVDVKNVNDAPAITSSAVTSVNERENYLYAVTATDPDAGDTLSYALDVAPVGMTIDTASGQISWTPGSALIGDHAVVLVVTDAGGLSDSQNFTVTVLNIEDAPVITSTAILSATEDLPYSYVVEAVDQDAGDVLTFALSAAPTGMTINNTGGLISWTPLSNQTGDHPVSVSVTDSTGFSATQDFTLNVVNVNDAPEILSTPVTAAQELEVYAYQLEVIDKDNDPVTFSLTTAPDGMVISNAGLVSWTPALGQAGSHPVTLTVTDTNAASVKQSYTITVDVVANTAPAALNASLAIAEDTELNITLTASDLDKDVLTYEILTRPSNGSLAGTAPDLVYVPNGNFYGFDSFTFKVNDGIFDSNTATVTITVSPINDSPLANGISIQTDEDTALDVLLSGSDIDGDALTFRVVAPPANGTLTGTGPGLIYTPNVNVNGNDQFTFVANDGQSDSNIAVAAITINSINDAPIITSSAVANGAGNSLYQYQVTALDPDDTVLSYALMTAPAGMSIDGNGLIAWTPDNSSAGNHAIEIQVQDGQGASAVQSFTLAIEAANSAPVIVSTPIAFVIAGDGWQYTLEANDPDGDSLTYSMTQAPDGAVFDPTTRQVSWPTTGVAVGNYDFQFSVSDSKGLSTQQTATIEVLSTERTATHEGTEFWIPVSINLISSPTSTGGTFDINLVSNGTDTEATIEIPALSVVETLSLTANQMATYSINLDEFAATEGFTLNALLENYAIHITAASPISAYFMNQKTSTTDGFLGLPAASLGQDYIAATYTMLGRLGISKTVDGGQLGAILTIVATEDNTQVTIDPIMDILPGDQRQIEVGNPIELTMNRGDVYNLEAKGSFKADLTGSMIRADKPISVIGQMECVYVPVNQTACDHLVEQLPPIESLSTDYYTVPFWGRTINGRFIGREYGDTFRVVAPYDNTDIYIDEVLRARLNQGDYYEYVANGPRHVRAGHPVLMVQYANGNQYDENYRELPPDFADPFMVIVPPAEQFLKSYTINTPARKLAYNYANLLVPTSVIATVTVDGQSIEQSLFGEIPNSRFSYIQLPLTPGSHHIEAQEPFGAYVYGYDYFESYGYLGGMALSPGRFVTSLSLTGEVNQTLDDKWCAESTVVDTYGRPVNGVRVKFNVAGVSNHDAYRFSDAHGIARYCYTADKPGVDTVTASLKQLGQSISIDWTAGTQNQAPVISSVPSLGVVVGESFSYNVVAEDPEGGELLYTLIEAPNSMTIDQTGRMVWPQVDFRVAKLSRIKIVLSVTDPLGLETVQSFELSEYKAFNTPPEFEPATVDLTATVGVPYVYNLDYAQHSLKYPKYQVRVDDVDEDAAFVDILSGPAEAYIQRVIAYYSDINRGNDPRSCEGCIHYFRWVPQAVGEQSFELGLRDARGGTAESLLFTVNVAPNLPPQIVGFNPQNIASAGYQYSYILNVENDVPPHAFDNLDDLKIVFEQAPTNMRYDLVGASGTQKLRIYWTPYSRDSRDVGLHTIRLRVDDRLNSSPAVEFTINVVDDNQPPVIAIGSMPRAEATIPYQYQISASDPDGDALTYSLAIAPEGMTVNEATGVISWVPSASYDNEHEWVRFVVTDAQGLTAEKTDLLYISAFFNRAPEFVPAYRPAYAKVGMEYVHQVLATDREGDLPISYRLRSSASGPTIDTQDGTITWTPTAEGSFWFNVQATDSLGNYASRNSASWNVQVVPDTATLDAQLQLSPTNIIDLGESVTLSVLPQNESTSPTVTLTVDGQPATLDALLQAQITPTRVGRIPVTAVISDGLQTVTRTIDIFVRDPADLTPPVVQINSPTNLADIRSSARCRMTTWSKCC